jgi:cytohesin
VGIAESKAHLKERLTLIARARRSWKWLALPVVLLIAGLGLTSAQTNSKPPPSSGSGSPGPTAASHTNNPAGPGSLQHGLVEAGALQPSALSVSTTGLASPADSREILAATAAGNLDEIRSLLKASPDLASAKDAYNQTPLHLAAGMSPLEKGGFVPTNCLAMAELFLAGKADVNARDNGGETPLLRAIRYDHKDVVELLLANKASPNLSDINGMTPLHFAAKLNRLDLVELLLANKAALNATNSEGQTPLNLAVEQGITKATEKNEDYLGRLMPDMKVERANMDVARLLLSSNAAYNLNDAAAVGDFGKAQALLSQHPALASSTNRTGRTPLHYAAFGGWSDIVELLLAARADVNAKDRHAFTPLHLAANKAVAALLLDHNADLNAKEAWDRTPLHWAALAGRVDVAELLLAHGADVNARNNTGCAPLHLAANQAVAEMLLDHKADVNATNNRGTTPLWLAADKGVAAALLDHNADVDAKGAEGFAPLQEAAMAGNADVAEVLLAHHANVDIRTDCGGNPLAGQELRNPRRGGAQTSERFSHRPGRPRRGPPRLCRVQVRGCSQA